VSGEVVAIEVTVPKYASAAGIVGLFLIEVPPDALFQSMY
jgi:hypothetical protein